MSDRLTDDEIEIIIASADAHHNSSLSRLGRECIVSRKLISELTAALKPLVTKLYHVSNESDYEDGQLVSPGLTFGHCRRARDLLASIRSGDVS